MGSSGTSLGLFSFRAAAAATVASFPSLPTGTPLLSASGVLSPTAVFVFGVSFVLLRFFPVLFRSFLWLPVAHESPGHFFVRKDSSISGMAPLRAKCLPEMLGQERQELARQTDSGSAETTAIAAAHDAWFLCLGNRCRRRVGCRVHGEVPTRSPGHRSAGA